MTSATQTLDSDAPSRRLRLVVQATEPLTDAAMTEFGAWAGQPTQRVGSTLARWRDLDPLALAADGSAREAGASDVAATASPSAGTVVSGLTTPSAHSTSAGAATAANDGLRQAVAERAERHGVDAALVPNALSLNAFKLIAFDMDSTVITIECIDEIADFAGLKSEVAAITAATMRGEISNFDESLRQRVALLKGLPEQTLERVYSERLRLSPGVEALLSGARAAGLKTLLVSGGFTYFAERLGQRLGFDQTRSNVLEIVDGQLTGRVVGDIVNADVKRDTVAAMCAAIGCSPSQAIVVGDGANDLKMMAIAGLSVAYRAKPIVRAQTDQALNHCGLDAILNFFEAPAATPPLRGFDASSDSIAHTIDPASVVPAGNLPLSDAAPALPAYLHRSDTGWSVFKRVVRSKTRIIADRLNRHITERTLRIGISARIFHPQPGSKGLQSRTLQYLEESIAHWVMSRNALVFMVPTVNQDGVIHASNVRLRDYARTLDGLVLQGGADISPQSYSLQATRPEWSGDRMRDIYELELLNEFIDSGKPVLGICRGCQLINVAFGGTLFQDIASEVPGSIAHVNESYEANHHEILFPPGSSLPQLFGGQTSGRVNSIHHQSINRLGRDLTVEAVAQDDQVVEAVRLNRAQFVFGLQWHPEFHSADRAGGLLDCTPILDQFLRAARETRF